MKTSRDVMLKQAFDAANYILQHKCTLSVVRRNLLPNVSEYGISYRLELIKNIDLELYTEVSKVRKEAAMLARKDGGRKAYETYKKNSEVDIDERERKRALRLSWFKKNLKCGDVVEYRKSYESITQLTVSSTYPNFFKAMNSKGEEDCYYYSLIVKLVK